MNGFLHSSLTANDFAFLAEGAARTVLLTLTAAIAGTLFGLALGVVRAEAGPIVNLMLGAVLDVARSVPLLIQLIIFNSFVAIAGFPLSPFVSGSVVLACYVAISCGEVVRAAVLSVPRATRRAARSLGLTYLQDLTYIVIPLGLRVAFPAWVGIVLSTMKDSALVSALGYFELLKTSQALITRIQEPLLILGLTGAFYFLLSFPLSRLAEALERRMRS